MATNYTLKRGKGNMLTYAYNACPGMRFELHLFSEVGEPFQPWFAQEIERRGYVVEYGREIDASPWVADFVTGREK